MWSGKESEMGGYDLDVCPRGCGQVKSPRWERGYGLNVCPPGCDQVLRYFVIEILEKWYEMFCI